MKTDISVIIPIYRGSQYIPYWLNKIEKNVFYLNEIHLRCELILVNDFPEEKIAAEQFQVVGFDLKVLNSEDNQGIHGARLYGLEHAQGKWVVFIDQDDWITDDYLVKQKLCIGDADAVICNGYNKCFCSDISKVIYADNDEQKRAADLSVFVSKGNPIYSPGQVMLKKEAIPYLWHQKKLKKNGADDYLLWMLMLKEGKKFILNEEKIYTHVERGSNASNEKSTMIRSAYAVKRILVKNNLLNDAEEETIRRRIEVTEIISRYAGFIDIYDYWLYLENRNRSIVDFLREHGYFKVGIYEMNLIGNRLYDLLAASDIETIFAIDKCAKKIMCSIPVFCLEDVQIEDYMKRVDVIIVTAQEAFEPIREELKKRNSEVSVLLFKSILLEMIESDSEKSC